MTGLTHAVVLGGSIAGTLAAAALAQYADTVTIIDRDRLPTGPEFRKGLPQARHAHLLLSGGARIIESLLPGVTDRLLRAGTHRSGVPKDVLWLTSYGWQRRFPATEFVLTCGRPLLDWMLRDHAVRTCSIALLAETDLLELCGDSERVTGVRVRDQRTGAITTMETALVVDATGRGSPLRRWLSALGLPHVDQDLVDTGIAYATRLFRAPKGAERFPLVNVLADHRSGRPGQSSTLVPIEGGRWIATLSGTRGGEPPTDEDGFIPFVRRLRSSIVADLLADAEPLTGVYGSRSTANRRFYYERLPGWPEGLVAVGDAVAAFNPVYAHGLSAAAHCAAALERGLRRYGLDRELAGHAQRAVGQAVDDPWMLAASQDLSYPDCRTDMRDPRLSGGSYQQQRSFADLVGDASLRDPVVSEAAAKVTTLSAPVSSLEAPHVIAALRRGAQYPPLTKPPLTAEESALVPAFRAAAVSPDRV
ncbi:FAD-dependent monooxygenase [Spirillospora sp. NBC_00431]